MDNNQLYSLPERYQAMVAVAVLLDGQDAEEYLANDSLMGSDLTEAAAFFASYPPEIRMPLAGVLLRAMIHK